MKAYTPHEIMSLAPVIPVLTIEKLADAEPLARALVAGGLKVLEITLRTDAALEAIGRIAQAIPEAVVGAGTLTTEDDFDRVVRAGAEFAISPGAPPDLLAAGRGARIPFLPGVATATELMTAVAQGYDHLKFFPAEVAGGIPALKALAGPFADVRFCPTGGIGADNAQDYLRLPNVMCVGGSWVAPKDAVLNGDWSRITALAAEARATVKAA